MNKLRHGIKYTGKAIIKLIGLRMFQELTTSGRIEWVADDSFGNKLYIYKENMKLNNNKFIDRRLKDGSKEDRKLTADCIRAGRSTDRKVQEIEDRAVFSASMLFICILLGSLLVICFIGKAHAEDIQASWYSVESLKKEGTYKHSKGVMANGQIFSDNNLTCACRLYPLGTYLLVSKGNKRVRVLVSDRIGKRFAKTRIDLSKSAFEKLANLKEGLIKVRIERIS